MILPQQRDFYGKMQLVIDNESASQISFVAGNAELSLYTAKKLIHSIISLWYTK